MLKQGYTCKYTAILFAVVRLYFPLRGIILSVRIYSTVCTALQLNSIIEENFYIQQACVGPSLAPLLKNRRWWIHCPCSCRAKYDVLPTLPIITSRFPNTKKL